MILNMTLTTYTMNININISELECCNCCTLYNCFNFPSNLLEQIYRIELSQHNKHDKYKNY